MGSHQMSTPKQSSYKARMKVVKLYVSRKASLECTHLVFRGALEIP